MFFSVPFFFRSFLNQEGKWRRLVVMARDVFPRHICVFFFLEAVRTVFSWVVICTNLGQCCTVLPRREAALFFSWTYPCSIHTSFWHRHKKRPVPASRLSFCKRFCTYTRQTLGSLFGLLAWCSPCPSPLLLLTPYKARYELWPVEDSTVEAIIHRHFMPIYS